MAKLVSTNQRIITGVTNPTAGYSRAFGLACKANAGIGVDDFAYSPPMGVPFRLLFMSLWYGGSDLTNQCGGTIYITFGTGVPTHEIVATTWEIIVPFWAGTTKPAIMVQGLEAYLYWPMNRLFTGEALRFGLAIENFSDTRPFWVNVWFEISEG